MLGDRYQFKCDWPFTLIGNEEVVCGKDGFWSGKVPFCQRRELKRMLMILLTDMFWLICFGHQSALYCCYKWVEFEPHLWASVLQSVREGGWQFSKTKNPAQQKLLKKNRASAFYFLGPILDVRKILAQAITHQIAHHSPPPPLPNRPKNNGPSVQNILGSSNCFKTLLPHSIYLKRPKFPIYCKTLETW